MGNNNQNAFFFKFIKLSDKDQNKAWTVSLILALGFLVKIAFGKLEDSYVRQLNDKDKTIKEIRIERDEYKNDNIKLYKERYFSNSKETADTVISKVEKLIDKLDKK